MHDPVSSSFRVLELLSRCGAFQRIHIKDEVFKPPLVFARDVVSTVDYRDSNQFEISKIKSDHFISKVGEEVVRQLFERYCKVKSPDYYIYSAEDKSWSPDLVIVDVDIAVKTQMRFAARRYGPSWTFQSFEFRKDPIFSDSSARVVFVEYEDVHFTHDCILPYCIKLLITYTPLKIAVNSSTSMPSDRLVFTNIKIVSGFGAKGANFVERTKLTHVTMRIIINVTKCLLSKTIP